MAVHIEFRARAIDLAEQELDPSKGVAGWLKERLQDSGIEVGLPTRYDWGYEIPIHTGGREYFAGLPSRKDTASSWHSFVEKRRSLADRVMGRTIMAGTEPMAMLIREIISRDPQFKVVRVQEKQ